MNNLKFLMERAGLSCLDIAKFLDISQQAVYKWGSAAAMPSAAKLPLLAEVLGCSIDELFGRAPPGGESPLPQVAAHGRGLDTTD